MRSGPYHRLQDRVSANTGHRLGQSGGDARLLAGQNLGATEIAPVGDGVELLCSQRHLSSRRHGRELRTVTIDQPEPVQRGAVAVRSTECGSLAEPNFAMPARRFPSVAGSETHLGVGTSAVEAPPDVMVAARNINRYPVARQNQAMPELDPVA
jgi:hypothetical protein